MTEVDFKIILKENRSHSKPVYAKDYPKSSDAKGSS